MNQAGKMGATVAAVLAAALVLTTLAAASAYAFVLTSDSLSNDFNVAECKIEVVEDFDVPSDVKPGSKITKRISFRNVGVGESYVRAFVELDKQQAAAWAAIDYNTNDWTFSEDDGYWYCNAPVQQGQTTPPICTTVAIDEDAVEGELESFDVIALGEAVLAKSPTGDMHASAKAAFQALAERSPK